MNVSLPIHELEQENNLQLADSFVTMSCKFKHVDKLLQNNESVATEGEERTNSQRSNQSHITEPDSTDACTASSANLLIIN